MSFALDDILELGQGQLLAGAELEGFPEAGLPGDGGQAHNRIQVLVAVEVHPALLVHQHAVALLDRVKVVELVVVYELEEFLGCDGRSLTVPLLEEAHLQLGPKHPLHQGR